MNGMSEVVSPATLVSPKDQRWNRHLPHLRYIMSDENHWLTEQLKTITNLSTVAQVLIVVNYEELLPIVLELLYEQVQIILDEQCIVDDNCVVGDTDMVSKSTSSSS